MESTETLINSHMGFIKKMAYRYGTSNNIDDLIQEGIVGLIIAAERFDEKQEVKFLTYASYWILKHMVLFLKTESRYLPADLEKYASESNPTDFVQMEMIVEARDLTQKAQSSLLRKNITKRDIDIVMSRYLTPDPDTLQTLATKHNISRERVRQIEEKWTTYLKKRLQL